MKKINIFDSNTYPTELEIIRKKTILLFENNIEFLKENQTDLFRIFEQYNNISSDSISILINEIKTILFSNNIVCFHNTRVLDIESIKKKGLLFPINGYKERIIIDLKNNNIPNNIIKMISSSIENILSNFINDPFKIEKHKQICFYMNINDYNTYSHFYDIYGGELLKQALTNLPIDDSIKNKILSFGIPYIIEFNFPFNLIEKYKQEEIIISLLLFWIKKYILKSNDINENIDGRIIYEIPKENIIKIITLD
ncbi:MAG: hypothetical protein KH032_07175 [[Clostridium] spiroforme]|uniref:hypothetical protein n=1 Tax=Thomasclavelia spiroformis TaxID=29348 RepID=UPI001D78B43C|nr:hypothetical protein [Thomasclavelia spiroformis]MBS7217015.1 hypothetical protein [Thomasclavelia spiroformis]